MPKRFSLKVLPTNRFELGDSTLRTFELEEGRQCCIVQAPRLTEQDLDDFRDTWQSIVGDQVDLIITNFEFDLTNVEITEIKPLEEVGKSSLPTRYERKPVI